MLLHNTLYALEIWRNVLSVVIFLKLDFLFHFESKSVKIYFGTLCFGCGFISDGFMVLDLNISINNSVVLLTSGDNVYDGSIKWYARLGHIGQDRIAKLTEKTF